MALYLGGLAKERRGHIVDRRAEVRVVEDVEEVGARLKREVLIALGRCPRAEIPENPGPDGARLAECVPV